MNKILLWLCLLCAATSVNGQQHGTQGAGGYQIPADQEQILLWPGEIPDGPGPRGVEVITAAGSVTSVSRPRLIVHRPVTPNGAAVLVISGGGYAHIERGKESMPTAGWLAAKGITAFELIYRLPQEGWRTTDVVFQDAQRAMKIIRKSAVTYGLDTGRIGILGFSAGGHLAGMTAARPGRVLYKAVDEADRLSARPGFAVLIYPVLTMMPPFNKTHARKSISGAHPATVQEQDYSAELLVNEQMPPTFLAQALNDTVAPVDNSLLMFNALRAANIPVEMHIFQSGGHGWGMGKPGTPAAAWPALFETWAGQNHFLTKI